MAQPRSPTASLPFAHHDRPWLLPTNRKLRNLVSISLRNLSLTPASPSRHRTKPVDDDALPQASKSPAKLVALQERRQLEHSRSSSDLRPILDHSAIEENEPDGSSIANGSPVTSKQRSATRNEGVSPKRPVVKRMRRRSTLEWANATPQRRQKKLDGVIKERMADVFFSLHVEGIEEPVYVSEMVEKTMNPTFGHIDWARCGPGIKRSDRMTLRVWVRGCRTQTWRQLLQLKVDLCGLCYLGKRLNDLDHPLPTNAVILHLDDGIYAAPAGSLSDLAMLNHNLSLQAPPASTQRPILTSSFDALLKLAKLDDSIQDALSVRDQIAQDLEAVLSASKEALTERDTVVEAQDRLKTIEYAKMTVEKQLEKARQQQDEKRASLVARKELMAADHKWATTEKDEIAQNRPEFSTSRSEHEVRKNAITNQRRRICEELQLCYPIRPLPKKTLAFSIRDLHLPNAEDLDAEPPETVAAAFGHVAHVLQLLSFYFEQPLPYPVTPQGSTSSIYDPVSILKTNVPPTSQNMERKLRTYPLFSKGMPRFRFEYAVFLINQDIRVLLESIFNIRVLDIRQTLPNLKYLLYVATAGDGELPARKAGGVRGLLRAPSLERSGSTGSVTSGISGSTLHTNGKLKGAAERLREIGGKA